MADKDGPRSDAIRAAVSALSLEKGFECAEKNAIEALSEILKNCITRVGHVSRTYSELAGRTAPTATDVEAALNDCRLNVRGLEEYSNRPERRHVQKQLSSHSQPPPKSYHTVGVKSTRPPNVMEHYPSLPDPHTFQRTLTFPKPVSDYQSIREKMATEMRDSRHALSRLLAKTRTSSPVTGTEDPGGNFSLVSPDLPKEPSFLLALTASPDDLQEADDEKEENPGNNEMEVGQDDDPSSLARPTDLAEECAYLRPPKRVKFKGL